MLINADRKGPKEVSPMVARMIQAAQEHQAASEHWDEVSKGIAEGKNLDGASAFNRFKSAQQELLDAHAGDAQAAQMTLNELARTQSLGKRL